MRDPPIGVEVESESVSVGFPDSSTGQFAVFVVGAVAVSCAVVDIYAATLVADDDLVTSRAVLDDLVGRIIKAMIRKESQSIPLCSASVNNTKDLSSSI